MGWGWGVLGVVPCGVGSPLGVVLGVLLTIAGSPGVLLGAAGCCEKIFFGGLVPGGKLLADQA